MANSGAEVWKTYPKCEHYQVSNKGRVRSIDRTVITKDNRKKSIKGVMLKTYEDKLGRPHVVPYYDGKHHTTRVSRMMVESFIRPLKKGELVRHLNDKANDNRLENLAIGDQFDNMRDCVRNGNHYFANKTHCPYGHEYVAWNLTNKKNARGCLSCARSRGYRQNRPHLDHQTVSDSYYEALKKEFMNG